MEKAGPLLEEMLVRGRIINQVYRKALKDVTTRILAFSNWDGLLCFLSLTHATQMQMKLAK
jgi:hypothetical protein